VGVVTHQSLLNDLVNLFCAQHRGLAAVGKWCAGRLPPPPPGNDLDKLAVGVVEDFVLALACEEQVRDRVADGVGDFTHVEITLTAADAHLRGHCHRNAGDACGQRAPFELGFLVLGCVCDAFERLVFVEQVR
jgi:hypothetical protein